MAKDYDKFEQGELPKVTPKETGPIETAPVTPQEPFQQGSLPDITPQEISPVEQIPSQTQESFSQGGLPETTPKEVSPIEQNESQPQQVFSQNSLPDITPQEISPAPQATPKELESFNQTALPEIEKDDNPIVNIPLGAMLQRGEFISPNYRKGMSGWKLGSDGLIEGLAGRFGPWTISGNSFSTTNHNIFIGLNAGLSITTGGNSNIGIGRSALRTNQTGDYNTAIGDSSLYTNEDDNNSAFGGQALYWNSNGFSNTGIGKETLFKNTTGNYNTGLGSNAGYSNQTGSSNIFIGWQAGYWETGSNKLFIDNAARTNEADGRVKALVYGVFDAVALNQQITFNVGTVNILDGGNIATGTGTGMKIGTATTQKLGFYNQTPVDQPATVSDAATQDLTGTDTINRAKAEADLTSCKNAINTIIDRLQELGLIA